jgi:hypothetical protein
MGPKFEEQGAFQDESAVVRGAAEAIEDSLKAVFDMRFKRNRRAGGKHHGETWNLSSSGCARPSE